MSATLTPPIPFKLHEALEQIVAAVASGKTIPDSDLIPFLCLELKEQRAWVNFRLADGYFRAGQLEVAKAFISRAWLLSEFSPAMLPLYVDILSKTNDHNAIHEAHKRLGMNASMRGNIHEALEAFNQSNYAYAYSTLMDKYSFDIDILTCIDSLSAPYRFHRVSRPASIEGRKIRIGYLIKGLAELNSVLLKINQTIVELHDKSRFEVTLFATETLQTLATSPQGDEWLKKFRAIGCNVVTAPATDSQDRSKGLLALGELIHNAQLDILITSAALADMAHYFVVSLRPAPIVMALVQGPLPLFVPPAMDWSIAWSKHPLMDTPTNCSLVELEVGWPELQKTDLSKKSELGISKDSCVLMSSGRPQKFQDRPHWQMIVDLLRKHPKAHYVVAGAEFEQIPFLNDLLPKDLRNRVQCLGWRENFLQLLGCADIVIDTYPTGGGQSLVQAMSLGLPIVGHRNNYMQQYDQTDWSPIEQFIDDRDIIVPRGDFAQLSLLLSKLIEDTTYRSDVGQRCKVRADNWDTAKGVREIEDIYTRVIQRQREQAAGIREDDFGKAK